MTTTPNFSIPELAQAQAQKHVTVNQGFKVIDTAMNLNVISRVLTAPPGSPSEGDKYIPAATATGAWVGQEDNIATFINGSWLFFIPVDGWRCFDQNTSTLLIYDGAVWSTFSAPLTLSADITVTEATNEAQMQFHILEEELTGLSGATVDTSIQIPNGAIVFNVSERVTTTITGATSFDVGVSGNTSQFGGTLGLTAGSTNLGVIGPTGFYAATAIRLTANGSNFTAGAVRIAIHYYFPQASQS